MFRKHRREPVKAGRKVHEGTVSPLSEVFRENLCASNCTDLEACESFDYCVRPDKFFCYVHERVASKQAVVDKQSKEYLQCSHFTCKLNPALTLEFSQLICFAFQTSSATSLGSIPPLSLRNATSLARTTISACKIGIYILFGLIE